MGSHHDNIKNKIAYFHKVIKNMDLKDNIKRSKINEYEIPIEEVMYDEFSNTSDVNKQLFQTSLLGWIELVENENLHKALKSLKIEDQIFISYIVKECKTQRELAESYNISHQNIGKRFNRILKKLRKLMER
ncbi:MAG: sigma-70 family RNA polymerase sigma factor [Clostridia bacterium]|nr:sigma-70 family RNA polymerase sigma factor [Clostridia bacterium]